jgi:DNA polymerase-1
VLNRNDVLNYAVQGASFHCLLWSLVQIHKWLKKNKMRTKIVGQIHDSIVADVYAPEKDDFLGMCKQVMTVDLLQHWKWLIVPMDIEAEIGDLGASWHELKGVKIP